MNLSVAKNELLDNKRVREAFGRKDIADLKIEIGMQILELRILKDITQAKLARLIGTEQPSIARAERGAVLPSLAFLHKIASALKTELIPPHFAAVARNNILTEIISARPVVKDIAMTNVPTPLFSAANDPRIQNHEHDLVLN